MQKCDVSKGLGNLKYCSVSGPRGRVFVYSMYL